jgi:hypothetical protein
MARNQKEIIECVIYYNWVRYNKLDKFIYHIANERNFNKKTASKGYYEGNLLKKMGVKAGILDYSIDRASNGYHGLKIEIKIKPNKLSSEQKNQIKTLTDEGYLAIVCWSGQEAIDATMKYLNIVHPHIQPLESPQDFLGEF